MIDAGTNGARNLGRFAVNPGRAEAVFLTHAHSEHIDGLGELGMSRWTGGGVRVGAFSVNHSPVCEAVGYRIDYRGRSIVSGKAIPGNWTGT